MSESRTRPGTKLARDVKVGDVIAWFSAPAKVLATIQVDDGPVELVVDLESGTGPTFVADDPVVMWEE